MIVINLCCEYEHGFEGWFKNDEQLQSQIDTGQLTCPICASQVVRKMPSAPSVVSEKTQQRARKKTGQGSAPVAASQVMAQFKNDVMAAQDVGDQFAKVAREMHREAREVVPIRGQASVEETRELLEEGIDVLPIPNWATKLDS